MRWPQPLPKGKTMSSINDSLVTVVLKARPGDGLSTLLPFLTLGSTVQIGRAGAVVASLAQGDAVEAAERLGNQIVLAESAMRRGALMHDEDHLPALRRVINHVPTMYLAVADKIRQEALDDGSDPDEAEEMAGQAIRALVLFKQNLEAMLEPDLLAADKDRVNQIAQNLGNVNQLQIPPQNIPKIIPGSLITESPVVAESVHIDKRVKAAVAEPSFLTIVFKLPTLNAAAPLIAQLPYGRKALGTDAEVFGLTTGNLMEAQQ